MRPRDGDLGFVGHRNLPPGAQARSGLPWPLPAWTPHSTALSLILERDRSSVTTLVVMHVTLAG
jgi:hypothetical protein